MNRLKAGPRLRLDRVDVMLALALFVVVSSYALGYRLDWSQLDEAAPAETEASAAPEAPAAPSAFLAALKSAPVLVREVAASGASSWATDPRQEEWDSMIAELERLASRHRGRVALCLTDLKSGRAWRFHENDLFPTASLIKVPIMAAVFYKIQEGQLSLYDRLTLRRHLRVGGSGSLKWRPDGTRLTVRELLQFMISESDNTATAMLLDAVGLGYVQRQLPKMGLLYTGIYEEGMSIRSGRVHNENYTTAGEMTMLMEKIYRGQLVDEPSSRLMLEILRHRKAVASRLAKGLPPGWEIAHKTGLLRQACHDSAIFFTPQGDYVMTVLTGQNGDYKSAKEFISRLGRVTFRHYSPRFYARAAPRRSGYAVR